MKSTWLVPIRVLFAATLATIACKGSAPSTNDPPAAATSAAQGPVDGVYRGRTIAQTCSYLGADWLDRPDREEREQPDKVLDALKLTPDMTVADVGAGTGYFSVRMAKRVTKVYATDAQPEMIELLKKHAAGLSNIEIVLAGEHDANLPEHCCDLEILVDVYHELADPPAVVAGLRKALKPGGRLVLVEYRGEDPKVAIKEAHKMTLPRIKAELEPLGFRFVDSLEFLPDQRVVIFTPDDRPR